MVEAGGIRELISVRVAGYFLVRTSALIYLIVMISMKCKMEKYEARKCDITNQKARYLVRV